MSVELAPAPPVSESRTLPRPVSAQAGRVRKDYLGVFVVIHLIAALAFLPYFFTWSGVIAFVIGVFLCGVMGVNVGMHRLLSHRSFRTPKWFERTLATLAMCGAQETPAHWVAWHRKHHVHSDHDGDPHSPRVGFLWSHVDWLLCDDLRPMALMNLYDKYARDIIRDPYYRWIERLPQATGLIYFSHALLFAILAGGVSVATLGWNAEAARVAASVWIWGVAVRTVYVWHITWSVNSLTHLIGYRSHETKDDSRNSFLVAAMTIGEGWHNNHHHDPSSASNQHRWWEFDPVYYIIRFLGCVGLASHIVPPKHKRGPKNAPKPPATAATG